jgi:hypothetical protein
VGAVILSKITKNHLNHQKSAKKSPKTKKIAQKWPQVTKTGVYIIFNRNFNSDTCLWHQSGFCHFQEKPVPFLSLVNQISQNAAFMRVKL